MELLDGRKPSGRLKQIDPYTVLSFIIQSISTALLPVSKRFQIGKHFPDWVTYAVVEYGTVSPKELTVKLKLK